MRKKEVGTDDARRDFLKLASVSVPAMATAAVVGTKAKAVQSESGNEGLRKTKHVKAYLDSARF